MSGIPVYETVKCAIIASSVGYKDNRACVLTEPYASIYILGDLVPIKLGNKYVVVYQQSIAGSLELAAIQSSQLSI